MSTPRVSIVLPTYNGSRYLAGAVAAIRAQTFTDWELVIIDDCSKDPTPGLIARLAASDPRIRAFRNETNQRLPRSLNIGFGHARGELLTWTSDDNEHRPDALAALTGFLDAHPATDLVYADAMDMDDDGRDIGPWRAPEPHELAWINSVNACFLYRRAVQQQLGGYDPAWTLVEDWDFWLRASIGFRLAPLHRDLYRYRRHAASLTSTRAAEIARARIRLMETRTPELPWLGAKGRCETYLKMARSSAEIGDPEAERRFHAEARKHAWAKATGTIALRRLLGHERAGALAQTLRRLAGR